MTASVNQTPGPSPDGYGIAAPLLGTAERAEAAATALITQLAELRERVTDLATAMSAKTRVTDAPPMLLTIEETARTLRIGRSIVWQLVKSDALRSVKIGASRRVPVEAITDYTSSLRAS